MARRKVQWKITGPLTPEQWIDKQPEIDDKLKSDFLRAARSDTAQVLWRRYHADRYGKGVGMDGAAFIQENLTVDPVWGAGAEVLDATGEPTLLAGPQGSGKSTLAQQFALARIGLRREVLDYPVQEAGTVFYLALDRPQQIQRSFARMVSGDDELTTVKERTYFWRGALPVDPAYDPELFAEWVMDKGDCPGHVVLDSYKDVGGGRLSDEDIGYNINHAAQLVVGYGVGWLGLHHHRKSQGNNKKPSKIDDIYGSSWLVTGCGSVLMLWGEPGSRVVELTHLKQPMETVGPLLINHEHMAGVSAAVDPETMLLQALRAAGDNGLTEAESTVAIYNADDSPARKRARRLLDRLTAEMVLRYEPGSRGGRGGGGSPARWWLK